jgi:hypothetical protein
MLSIIIVNFKSSRDINVCLESIVKHEPLYRDYEIIIVDNNSNDEGLAHIQKRFSFAKIIYAEKNGGFAYGNNVGIQAALGDYILLLNPDTYLTDNSIQKLYDRVRTKNDVMIAGPKLLFTDGSNQSYFTPKSYLTLWKLICDQLYLQRIFKKIRLFNSYFRTYMDYGNESYVEQVSGAAFLISRKVIDSIGLLDENYFMYFEESDYCYQAVRRGIKLLYFPESTIYHIGGLMAQSNWERTSSTFVESLKYYFTKNFGKTHRVIAVAICFIGSAIRILLLALNGDPKSGYYRHVISNLVSVTGRS